MPYFVYLLVSSDNSTYIGATIDLDRRLRQHNKEIKGGARATGIKVQKGQTWNRVCHVRGFPDWKTALQFEWRWKHMSRKLSNKMNPYERRMEALTRVLALDRPTTNAIPYTEWMPEIIMS